MPTADPNAIMCPGGLCTIMGNSGYNFAYGDMGPVTVYCAGANAACLAGQTSPTNPPSYTYYGIGIGINLATGSPVPPVQLTGAGLTVKLSALPAPGARVVVTVAGVDYCAAISTNPITIPWANFNTKCWDGTGTALPFAPATPHIEVQVVSNASVNMIDFCIEQISWQ
jgi:hypothetical protein